jgi:hypothetical protein
MVPVGHAPLANSKNKKRNTPKKLTVAGSSNTYQPTLLFTLLEKEMKEGSKADRHESDSA